MIGAEGSAWNLFRAYQARGHDSWLAVGYKQSSDPNVFVIPNHKIAPLMARPLWWLDYKLLHPIRTRVRGAYRLSNAIRNLASPAAIVDTWKGVENFNFPGTRHLLELPPARPDLVHCHNLHGDYFDLRALPYLSRQVPVILNLRDAWLLTGHCAHAVGCDRWMIGCGHCPDLGLYPAVRRDSTDLNWQRKQEIYRQSHLYITAISEWLMSQVTASMLQGVRYRVIPNGIDISLFAPGDRLKARAALDLPPDARIVLLTGHNSYKDYQTMSDALQQVQSPGRELIFICLGLSLSPQKVGQGTMHYPGIIRNRQTMAQYYQAADVYVHAARQEAFGKTITEAMACGVPVVATAVGGIPEQIDDGETGYLVPPRDSSMMAQRMMEVFDNPDRHLAMAQAARAVAQNRYSLEAQTNAFLDWYGEILDDWKHTSMNSN